MRILLFLIILSAHYICTGQVDFGTDTTDYERPTSKAKSDWKEKIVFGGGGGLQFGTNTAIDLRPRLGYKITEELIAGVTLNYLFIRWNGINTNIYGGGAYAQYFIIPELFAHAELTGLNVERVAAGISQGRGTILLPLLGGGYRLSIGQRSGVSALVLFNLSQSVYSPYQNPIIQFNFTTGF